MAIPAEAATIEEVQPVMAPAESQDTRLTHESDEGEAPWTKGEVQAPAFRDPVFAVLFWLQLIAVIVVAAVLGPAGVKGYANRYSGSNSSITINTSFDVLVGFFGATFAGSTIVTLIVLIIMVRCAKSLVHISFFFSPVVLLIFTVCLFAAGNTSAGGVYLAVTLIIGALNACCYCCIKHYIPFAASNLRTAMAAIKRHSGLFLLSLSMTLVTYAWLMVWIVAVVGVFFQSSGKKQVPCPTAQNSAQMCYQTPNVFVLILLFLSLYWTLEVLHNVMHVTTAGTVGTWWFQSEDETRGACASCCSFDICDSFFRAMTYSFGSICFGSLLVAIVQVLELLAAEARARASQDGNACASLLFCILECVLSCIRGILEYFNTWAFVYVGLYGYPYLTAGKNVLRLFNARGWTTFITDQLAYRVLMLCRFGVALFTGGIAWFVDVGVGPVFASSTINAQSSNIASFFVGFAFGLVLSNISLFVVESAVRTIIVCFAESPAEFMQNHPEYYNEMKSGWEKVYPDAWVTPLPEARATVVTGEPVDSLQRPLL